MFISVKKIISVFLLCCLVLSGITLFVACEDFDFDISFENRCFTTDDGFVCYEDSKIGMCIIALPDSEEVVIPEFIRDKPVKQLGYEEVSIGLMQTHRVDGNKVKKLTIQHTMDYFSVSFPNVETLVYVDILYCINFGTNTAIIADNYLVSPSHYLSVELKNLTNIILTTRNEEGFTNENIDTVYIPDIVSNITNNTFAHSEVLIVTS
ncbi:MAG: hypothetical protein LBF12_03460, partial [Christensenellaceae bacterium]|nr:hypothetical protein [Christensenellaceae bacterium]